MFIVMYHSLLIGASLFVPIPFLDERLAAYLWKRMISELAKSHQKTLSNDQISALSYQYRFVLSDGCLLVGKRIFRQLSQEILFFLEWRKALDLATDAYYSGYLINELFSYDKFDPAKVNQYALAILTAKKGFNMKLMRGVMKGTFQSSRGVVTSIVKWLSSIAVSFIKNSKARRKRGANRKVDPVTEKDMGQIFEENEPRLESLISQLKSHFEDGLGKLPKEHFDDLSNKMFEELRRLENV